MQSQRSAERLTLDAVALQVVLELTPAHYWNQSSWSDKANQPDSNPTNRSDPR